MPYYIFSIVAILIHIIINFETFLKKDSASSITSYRAFLISVLLFYITDILWGVFYEMKLYVPLVIDTYLYFVFMGNTVFCWTLFIIKYVTGRTITSNLLKWSSLGLLILEATLLIINMFKPIFFEVTKDSTFIPLIARSVIFILQITMYLSISIFSIIYNSIVKDKEVKRYVSITSYCVIAIICIIIQLFNPLIPFYPIGCLLGTCIIDTFALNETKDKFKEALDITNTQFQINKEKLDETLTIAYVDPLTGFKNRNAYTEEIDKYDKLINDHEIEEFAVIVFDINDLKLINDTFGHAAGDKYIIASANLIKEIFADIDIFRFGGDEFVVILDGDNYINKDLKYQEFVDRAEKNLGTVNPVIAAGISTFDKVYDYSYRTVFSRADKMMYERKEKLKKIKK